MTLVYTRKGAGNGRVLPLDTIKNSQGSIMNKYVAGSGVGATSTFARRAKYNRATQCIGLCNMY